MTARRHRVAISLLLLAAGCRPAAPGEWHQETGYRWRTLGGAGRGTDGFTAMAAGSTGIDFANRVSEEAAFQNRHFMHGSGLAIGDVDGDGRPDVYLSRIEGPNALYLNQGSWKFREAAAERGVALGDRPSTGAVLADVDGDGDLDLVVTSMGGRNALFRNDGTGHFADVTAESGFVPEGRGSTTAALADVDGDGDLDLYVANYKARTMLDSLSPQQRAFDQVVKQTGEQFQVIPERAADYRLQMRKDIEAVSLIQRADPDWFYLNDGTGHFAREPIAGNPRFLDEDGKPLETEPEDFGLAARFQDVNGDGAPDLYVANDFEDPDQFWINDGQGHFRLIARQAIRRTANSNMAVDFSDIDHDGNVDLFQADMLANDSRRLKTQTPTHTPVRKPVGEYTERAQWQRNALLLNRGDGSFAEIADAAGVAASGWSWSAVFLDVDLDGWEDLLIGNGHTWDLMDVDSQEKLKSTWTGVDWRRERQFYPKLLLPNVAFRNRGDRTFEDVSRRWRFGMEPDISHGISTGDLDGDGDLDVVINRLNTGAAVLRNDAPAPRIAVRLKGKAPNTAGIGARIHLKGAPAGEQVKEVTAGGLYLSGADQEYAFAARSDSTLRLEVRWRDGMVSRLDSVQAGRLYEVDEAGATRPTEAAPAAAPAPLFEDVSARLEARHAETLFNDYARQPLLPMQLSQLGPGVSWLDLDGDGDDDLVIPDGAGGALAWYRNDGARFVRQDLGVAAGALDFTMALKLPGTGGVSLLVGRFSYRAENVAAALAVPEVLGIPLGARGHGAAVTVVPGDTAAMGPLALADVDGDGDLDLFVGARVTAAAYPVPPPSHLYLNEAGGFVRDASNEEAFRLAGMVSAALFTDLDGDGDPDLVLATDWGPVRIFSNTGGRFAETTAAWGLDRYTGGWKGVSAGDFNGDGRIDLVATNWGRNLPFVPDSTNPLYLYVGNFGPRQTVDLVTAVRDPRLKVIAPLGSYSRLAAAIPEFRQRVPTFGQYADASVEQLLGPGFPKAIRIQATTYDHLLLLNTGSRFTATPLPEESQYAPAFAAVAADFDGDGNDDLFLGQNFSQTETGAPRFDAGRGLLLLGNGRGRLTPVAGQRSGIVIYGDQRGAAASDFDRDGRVDLAVSQNAGPARLYRNAGAAPGLRVRLAGPPGNPDGIGAQVRVVVAGREGLVREVRAGSNYWSADGVVLVFGIPQPATEVRVRWPGGATTAVPVAAGQREVVVPATAPPGSR